MPPPTRKYDALGFPIPATFDDLAMPDRDAIGAPKPIAAPRQRGASRRKRIILGVILVAVLALAAVPWLMDAGQNVLGDWLADRARKRFNNGDMPGTVADSTRAFTLLGDELNDERRIELLAIRACAKLEIHDLEGSRADFDRVLTSPKTRRDIRELCYYHRAWVNCRLQDYQAAVADATEAIELHGRDDATLLNHRAYIRALANASHEELEAGLKDVERAIKLERRPNPAYIDTRGYLRHLLGKNDDALTDMDLAIHLTSAMQQRVYSTEALQRLKENLAVMYYHRGLIHRAKGQNAEADSDLSQAEEFGYNPAAGVL